MSKKAIYESLPTRRPCMTDKEYGSVCAEVIARNNSLYQKSRGDVLKKALIVVKAWPLLSSDEYKGWLKEALKVDYVLKNRGFITHFAIFDEVCNVGKDDSAIIAGIGQNAR